MADSPVTSAKSDELHMYECKILTVVLDVGVVVLDVGASLQHTR